MDLNNFFFRGIILLGCVAWAFLLSTVLDVDFHFSNANFRGGFFDAKLAIGLWTLVSFFLGAIPFGLILAKWQGINLLEKGSGNIGATNVTRVLGKRSGKIIFFADFTKGLGTVAIFYFLFTAFHLVEQESVILCYYLSFASFFGHIFSPFLHLRGGKGVSTFLGTVLFLHPVLAISLGAIFYLVYKITKTVAVASLSMMIFYPILLGIGIYWSVKMDFSAIIYGMLDVFFSKGQGLPTSLHSYGLDLSMQKIIWILATAVWIEAVVFYTHWENILRLVRGSELNFDKKS